MKVQVRYLQPGEYALAAKFLDEHWAKDHIYCRSQPLFDWTFAARPPWDNPGYSFAIAERGEEIIGVLGAIPFEMNLRGATSPALWLANWMTRADHRSSPAGMMLLGKFRRPPFSTIISFGINEAVARIYRVMRWHVMDEIPRHLVVLPEARERMQRLLCIAHDDWPEDKAQQLVEPFLLREDPPGAAEACWPVWEAWDRHDWPALAPSRIGASRNQAYLTWRYAEHPLFEYRPLIAREGDRTGLLVWRLETIRRKTEAGLVDLERFGRLVEFLPTSEKNARQLWAAFLAELRQADAIGADYYGYHSATGDMLASLGMPRTEVAEDGAAIPSRFQPLDGKGGAIQSAVLGVEEPPTSEAGANCAWYWTKSDSDQDRPN